MNFNAEEVIVGLAIKYRGDWKSIYKSMLDPTDRDLDEYIKIAKKMRCKYVTILSENYPKYLKQFCMPPFVLFYYGDLSLISDIGKNIAVVGSRVCSDYGSKATKKIVSEIAREFNIVSGLAAGIDAIAHETAILAGGKTIAVLGCGIDYCYPPCNQELYNEIKQNHLLLSEYPGYETWIENSFPLRNRIIAMLSCGTIVTEAKARSGTLTTVMHTLDNGKTLMCVPYHIDEESECNRLISGGAYLIQCGKDVIEIMKNNNHF